MKTILLLGHKATAIEVLRPILGEYRVMEATSAEHALQLFRKQGEQLDLLIADVTLPVSSGAQLAQLFRFYKPELPMILTSTIPMTDWTVRDYADLVRLGPNAMEFFETPLTSDVFSDAVIKLLGLALPEKISTA